VNNLPVARDGFEFFIKSNLPFNKQRRSLKLLVERDQIVAKLSKIRNRGYLEAAPVLNCIRYFPVPKGQDDIRIVYDGTEGGLSVALWAPSFYLPNGNSALRNMDFDTFCVDLDLGEMFLNFPMHEKLRPFSGVDLTPFRKDLHIPSVSSALESWGRLFMGMKPSPYLSVRFYYLAEEIVRGSRKEHDNPMRFDEVLLNLPGSPNFDSRIPFVRKWNARTSSIAGDVVVFIDDLRGTGPGREESWQVGRRIASRLQFLGIQDAPRKRRPPSQTPGAWAGCVFKVSPTGILKSVTLDKWNKGKSILRELEPWTSENGPQEINRKDLEKKTGFLLHLTMTFSSFRPFMKGFHLTLNSWRTKRDGGGWKLSEGQWKSLVETEPEDHLEWLFNGDDEVYKPGQGPENVRVVPRFRDDIRAFSQLMRPTHPPDFNVRVKSMLVVRYGFGDASGSGFGSSFTTPTGCAYRIGTWGSDSESESSNWREFTNSVECLEAEGVAGRLKNTMVFYFTDNSTVEACSYRGSSSSRLLHELVVRIKALEVRYSCTLFVIHVSGTRMINQGTDGLSRGQLTDGVMDGEQMLSFVPIHLSTLERSPSMLDWIRSWSIDSVTVLEPIDWYERGHGISGWHHPGAGNLSHPAIAEQDVLLSPYCRRRSVGRIEKSPN